MKTVAFTGYRPEKLGFPEDSLNEKYIRFRSLQTQVIKRLIELGYDSFISGVARGFDLWTAEEIIELKSEISTLKLICAVPFPAQDKQWNVSERQRRESVLLHSDKIVMVSPAYTKNCFLKRNRYMVDNADVVVCCFDGQKGGTAYTVEYAKKKQKTVIQIDPSVMKVSVFGEISHYV